MHGNEQADADGNANANADADADWIRTKNNISPHPPGWGTFILNFDKNSFLAGGAFLKSLSILVNTRRPSILY